MIKCKNDGCPKGKECCCFMCDEKEKCNSMCDSAQLADPAKCEDAIVEGKDGLELFRSTTALALDTITSITKQKKALEETESKMRTVIQEKMEEFGITKFSNDVLTITYVPAGTQNRVDSKKLKEEYPDIAEKCVNVTKVKASVRIKAL